METKPQPTVRARFNRALSLALAGIVAAAAALGAHAPVRADASDDDYDAWEQTPIEVVGAGASLASGRTAGFVELPVRSVSEWTPAQVKAALRDTDSGNLRQAADLVEAIMGDDRVQGVLSTRTHGLLGLPTQFYGNEEQVKALEGTKALQGQPAIPGDWIKMFPEAEAAHLMAWGILLGAGLAERVPVEGRQLAMREVPDLRVWHPRWLRHEWTTQKWWLMTSEGEIEIKPGDGRWILYTPYGRNRPWSRGAWRAIAPAWVLKQFSLHDRARHSEVQGSPARVGTAPIGANEPSRRRFLRDLRSLGRDAAMVLPEGYEYKVVEAVGRTWEIYGAQIEWADRAIAIVLTGQFVTTEGTKGFSNGNIHEAVKHDLIVFTAEGFSTCLHEQGVVPWAVANWADGDVAPWQRWDTTPPEDKKATAEALGLLGDSITKLDAALAASGRRADAAELASKFGVPMLVLPRTETKAPTIAFAPTDVAKFVRVDEGRAGAGLGPWGDSDGALSVAAFAAKQTAPPPAPAPATPFASRSAAFLADLKAARSVELPVDAGKLASAHEVAAVFGPSVKGSPISPMTEAA